MGLAFILPAGVVISMFIGGLIALLLRHGFRAWSARFWVAICAGVIVGESLAGIGIAMEGVLAR